MIERMTKYSFILLERQTSGFLSDLQELGVVDITRSTKVIDAQSAEKMAECDALKKRIAYLRSGRYEGDSRYDELLAALQEATKRRDEVEPWGAYDRDALALLAANGIKLDYYCCPSKAFNGSWAEEYALEVIGECNDKKYFVIVHPSGEPTGFPVAACPAPEITSVEAQAALADAEAAVKAREKEIDEERRNISSLEEEYADKVAGLDLYLAGKSVEKAGEDTIDVLIGFAPTDGDKELCATLDGMDVFYIKEDASVEDEPPIKLRNNRFASMFEVLTDMYGRPAYNGFDPTPYISVFFLLFFAMCMGDAGYGIILMIVGILLKKNKGFAGLSPLVITLGAGTFVIGMLFHTFFSVDIAQWGWIPQWLKNCMVPAKIAGYDGTMILAIAIGIIHLCLAMTVKAIEETKTKGFLECLGTWGWTLLIVGGTVTGAVALSGIIDKAAARIIIIVLGIISAHGIFILNDIHSNPLKNIGSGLWTTYNTVTGILGDVLSYLRLYALGLAGSMLGSAFNQLGGMILGDGGLRWVPFLLIVIIGHTLNIAMAALGAFVHPLRLNFLEFFKNSGYEGSGRNYNPLTKKQS